MLKPSGLSVLLDFRLLIASLISFTELGFSNPWLNSPSKLGNIVLLFACQSIPISPIEMNNRVAIKT